MTKWQKQVKVAVANNTTIWPDRVICKKDGSVEMRRGFFYRHGMTADKWAADMEAALQSEGLEYGAVESAECWHEWPTDSYFSARIYANS